MTALNVVPKKPMSPLERHVARSPGMRKSSLADSGAAASANAASSSAGADGRLLVCKAGSVVGKE